MNIVRRSERPSTSATYEGFSSYYFNRCPNRAMQRAETDLQILHSVTHRKMREIIHLFPYKRSAVQRLELADYEARLS